MELNYDLVSIFSESFSRKKFTFSKVVFIPKAEYYIMYFNIFLGKMISIFFNDFNKWGGYESYPPSKSHVLYKFAFGFS